MTKSGRSHVHVFGQVRPAKLDKVSVTIQRATKKDSPFETVRTVNTGTRGFVYRTVQGRGGVWRIVWSGSDGPRTPREALGSRLGDLMSVRVRLAGVLALAALAAGGIAPAARASSGAEVGMEDGRLLFYLPDAGTSLLPFWKLAGVDVVRLHARWVSISPGTNALKMPAGFHPTDPDDPKYLGPAGRGRQGGARQRDARRADRDRVGPLWSSASPARHNPRWKPIPEQFAAFATAVARRYGAQVDRYMLYNEPNQSGWLQPQGACSKGRCHPVAPHLYRALVRAAYRRSRRRIPCRRC